MFDLRVRVAYLLWKLVDFIVPPHWTCNYCGHIERSEREVRCWKCGRGEMIYKGDIP